MLIAIHIRTNPQAIYRICFHHALWKSVSMVALKIWRTPTPHSISTMISSGQSISRRER